MKVELGIEREVLTTRIWQRVNKTRSSNTEESDWWVKTAEGNNTGEGSGADDRTEERLRKQVRK